MEYKKIPNLCGSCNVIKEKLLKCSRCKSVYYCSVECQKIDWKKHKLDCVVISPEDIKDHKRALNDFTTDMRLVTFVSGICHKFVNHREQFLQCVFSEKDNGGCRSYMFACMELNDNEQKKDYNQNKFIVAMRYCPNGLNDFDGKSQNTIFYLDCELTKKNFEQIENPEIYEDLRLPILVKTDGSKFIVVRPTAEL
jgi:hypothetical protein